jgi:hypothetical protein
MSEQKNYPLILVFYLERDLMENPKIMKPYADMVNDVILVKDANIIAFFLPTDGEERIEALNPQQIQPVDQDKITKIIEDIRTNFDIKLKQDELKNQPTNEQ